MSDRTGPPKDPVLSHPVDRESRGVDRQIVRLAVLCQVKLLEPSVILRVLQKDASICGAPNAKGFAKLHDLIFLNLAMREKSLDSFGPAQTPAMEYVIERLRTSFPDVPGGWEPA